MAELFSLLISPDSYLLCRCNQTLEHRRHTARLTNMYKIQHSLVYIPLSKYTQPVRTHCATEHLSAGRRGHPLQLRVQRSRLQAYKHSFFISTIEPWNKLTVQTINAPSIEAFKECLKRDSSTHMAVTDLTA